MEEKENQAVAVAEVKAPTDVKSFRCAAPKSDWHIFLIALLTSAIVVAAYHVTIMAIDMFCEKEIEPVYCACHQGGSEDEDEEEKPKRKFSPETMERFKARREAFLKKLSPEQREKFEKMSKEERREFLKKYRAERKKDKKADAAKDNSEK